MIFANEWTGPGERGTLHETPSIDCWRKTLYAAARIFRGALLLVVAVCGLAACAPSRASVKATTATAQPSATATPAVIAAPRLVYQADWSHGLGGWSATSGWTVSAGALQSDTGSDLQLTIPFQPTAPDYAIEFTAQVISVSPSATDPKQFDLSVGPAGGADGFVALFDHITLTHALFPSHPHEVIYIDPMEDSDPNPYDIHDYEPQARALTYRVEVRGAFARLLINDRLASWAQSNRTQTLAAGPLRFDCTGVQLRLSDLKVYSL